WSCGPPLRPIHTPSLHDALPICIVCVQCGGQPLAYDGPVAKSRARRLALWAAFVALLVVPFVLIGERHRRASKRLRLPGRTSDGDRKSTRLNSSHLGISYAVFCL